MIDQEGTDALDRDRAGLDDLLALTLTEARRFLQALDDAPAGHHVPAIAPQDLPSTGLGAAGALDAWRTRYAPWMSGSPGPRYFGFVTGGATPAALMGDWLTTVYDQNGSDGGESGARQLSLDALAMVRDLIGLPGEFQGVFVTGATASATACLATARQWVGRRRGVDPSVEGVGALGPVAVLSGTAHSSIPKALSIIGLGRTALRAMPTLEDREAVDVDAVSVALDRIEAEGTGPAIVVANAGTVNTCDFDDLAALAALKDRWPLWLHVDGAFGAIAGASPRFRPLLEGLSLADSVTVDAHKWLNVPYDCGLVFTRHLDLQGEVFRSSGAYLPAEVRPDTLIHLTPENSQRLRALATWMSLVAYGKDGYARIVERCADLATWLGSRMEAHASFRLLAPVRLNGICFTLREGNGEDASAETVTGFLERVRRSGEAFLTPTTYDGVPAARISITNWRTRQEDVARVWKALEEALP